MKETIFRERDIRGRFPDEINEEIFRKIGNVFAQVSDTDIIVARDARNESPLLASAFIQGVIEGGKTVMNIGLVPQACAIFWAIKNNMNMAYVTASHLPKGNNGVKFFHKRGFIFNKNEVSSISEIVKNGKYVSENKAVVVKDSQESIYRTYAESISGKTKGGKKIRVLLDCGNGVNGLVVGRVFGQSGFDTDVIFEEPNGNFPNRSPDPKSDPLNELKRQVKNYDIGIAYDADGDRFFAVSPEGEILRTEQIAYILLLGLTNQKGGIIANIECGRGFNDLAVKFGRDLIQVPVGVMHMEAGVIENKAVLGIEAAQHCFVSYVSEFGDAIAASAWLCRCLADSGKKLNELMREVRVYPFLTKNYVCKDEEKFIIMQEIEKTAKLNYKNVNTMDGIRVDFEQGFVLIRPSQSEGIIRFKAEADNENELERLQKEFSSLIESKIGGS